MWQKDKCEQGKQPEVKLIIYCQRFKCIRRKVNNITRKLVALIG